METLFDITRALVIEMALPTLVIIGLTASFLVLFVGQLPDFSPREATQSFVVGAVLGLIGRFLVFAELSDAPVTRELIRSCIIWGAIAAHVVPAMFVSFCIWKFGWQGYRERLLPGYARVHSNR